MLSAIIVDDEPLARAHLRRMLEAQDVEIVAEAGNGLEALRLSEDLHPDLLFLDVQMPGLTGMQAASALLHLDRPPLIVFVTGYSEHAVAAFDNAALDYLVKPVSPERLATSLIRARSRIDSLGARQAAATMVERRASETPLRRLPVREDYSVLLVRFEDIVCATAREKRVYVRTQDRELRTYYTVTQLESLLPEAQFLRIHESCIVNLDAVQQILFLGNHSYAVLLTDGLQLPVSRSRYAALQRRMGMVPDATQP